MLEIRKAELRDVKEITKIYNHAILNTNATFDTKEKTIKDQEKWFNCHGPNNPILVAELNKDIVGWASLSPYSTKCAYSDTAELSLYIKENHQGKGFGKQLMKAIDKKAAKSGLHAVISRITQGNEKSIKLHEKLGFIHVGVYKEVGYKFGKRLDVYLMQKLY